MIVPCLFMITGDIIFKGIHLIIFLGLDLLISESLFNNVVQIEEFSTSENLSVFVEALLNFFVLGFYAVLKLYVGDLDL